MFSYKTIELLVDSTRVHPQFSIMQEVWLKREKHSSLATAIKVRPEKMHNPMNFGNLIIMACICVFTFHEVVCHFRSIFIYILFSISPIPKYL